MEKIAGSKKNIAETKVVAAAHSNEDILWDFKDGFESVRKARRLEGMLYGSRVYGNQTAAIELKASSEDAIKAINLEYRMTRYLIDEINNLGAARIRLRSLVAAMNADTAQKTDRTKE